MTKAFEYISLESPQHARKVVETRVDLTLAFPENPLKHPLDKYKTDNDGTRRDKPMFLISQCGHHPTAIFAEAFKATNRFTEYP